MNTSSRLRAFGLLAVTFLAGGVAGAALYRLYSPPGFRNEPPRREGRRDGGATAIEADRIPFPIEALGPTREEEERLHDIARRWRPRAAQAVENIRASVADLENDMFAEMLCVISKDKQDRYLATLQENGGARVLIEKRFRLVRSNQCGPVREGRDTDRR